VPSFAAPEQQLCQEVPVKVYGNNASGGTRIFEVPAKKLVPLPGELSFRRGPAIDAAPSTPTARLRRRTVRATDHHAIFGQEAGRLAATQYAKAMAESDTPHISNRQRLRARQSVRRDEVVNPGSNDPVASHQDLTHGRYAD